MHSTPVPGVAPDKVLLSVADHRRDLAGMAYAYPVLSRRAGGVSLGINLNVNNACNWACVYCQVPDLVRGGPPPVDLPKLAAEFDTLLGAVLAGRFESGDAGRPAVLVDVAFSGNGEPTSSPEFGAAAGVVLDALGQRGLAGKIPVRVITNGSLLHRPEVQDVLRRIGNAGGEVWFKVDRATEAGTREVNGTAMTPDAMRTRLLTCCDLAPTWIQTCWFMIDGLAPCEEETSAYVDFVAGVATRVRGVHLYGIARPSLQPAAGRLNRLDRPSLEALAGRLNEKGLTVNVSP
jgi:wyosine [tRNA(Phe)-imidazoG37] synthetase (radical SAM superfamily)